MPRWWVRIRVHTPGTYAEMHSGDVEAKNKDEACDIGVHMLCPKRLITPETTIEIINCMRCVWGN